MAIQRRNRGFSLIETMIAIALLAMISIPVSNSLLLGMNSINRSRRTTMGIALAQERIEEVKTTSFDELLGTSSVDIEESIFMDGVCFFRSTIIETEGINLVKVTVELSWEGGGELRLVTYRGKY